MASDLRLSILDELGEVGGRFYLAGEPLTDEELLARLDKEDPLRLALREPSDELIEKIARNASGDIMAYARDVINGSREVEDVITSVLLALVEAVTPGGK
jgi:hypothetical protein